MWAASIWVLMFSVSSHVCLSASITLHMSSGVCCLSFAWSLLWGSLSFAFVTLWLLEISSLMRLQLEVMVPCLDIASTSFCGTGSVRSPLKSILGCGWDCYCPFRLLLFSVELDWLMSFPQCHVLLALGVYFVLFYRKNVSSSSRAMFIPLR